MHSFWKETIMSILNNPICWYVTRLGEVEISSVAMAMNVNSRSKALCSPDNSHDDSELMVRQKRIWGRKLGSYSNQDATISILCVITA